MPGNPRSHTARQIRQLARSISAFGFNVPILVDRGLRVVAGHAALQLGLSEVPTILLDHLMTEARTPACPKASCKSLNISHPLEEPCPRTRSGIEKFPALQGNGRRVLGYYGRGSTRRSP